MQAASRGDKAAPLKREKVAFLVPGRSTPLPRVNVTQRDLNDLLTIHGSYGFELASSEFSQSLEDLPEGGTVRLGVPDEPSIAKQVVLLPARLPATASKPIPEALQVSIMPALLIGARQTAAWQTPSMRASFMQRRCATCSR